MSDDLTALEERFNLRLTAELADVRGELRTGLADVRGELRTGLADVRGELRTGLADVRTEIADLRGDIEAKLRSQTWAMVSTLVGVSGLVFTLTRFT